MSGADRPPVLILTEDLFIVPPLADGLRQLGYQPQTVERPADLEAEGDISERSVPLTEPLSGADADLIRRLTEIRPALILIDMTSGDLPWERWVQVIKTSAATRRIPIIAFGPHVEEDAFQRAQEAGANLTVARGRLHSQLEALVREHARTISFKLLEASCDQPLSELARQGISLHNRGEYFEAHEELEHAWMEEEGEAGYLYRALLQVTVAHLHIVRDNFRGATKMLLRVRQWLDPLPDACRGIDVRQLRAMVQRLRRALEELGPDRMQDLDHSLLGPFPLLEGALPPSDGG